MGETFHIATDRRQGSPGGEQLTEVQQLRGEYARA
jgi:hypothetical protein